MLIDMNINEVVDLANTCLGFGLLSQAECAEYRFNAIHIREIVDRGCSVLLALHNMIGELTDLLVSHYNYRELV